MNYCEGDRSHIVYHIPKIKQHFPDVDQSYPLQSFDVIQLGRKKIVSWWFNNLSLRNPFDKNDSRLKPLNKTFLRKHDKLHQNILWVPWLHSGDIFYNASLVKHFPTFKT